MKFRDGLFLGVVIGLASAFLCAPRSGEETREEVKDKINSVPKHFFNLLESLLDLSASVLDFARESFQGQGENISKAVSTGINAAKEKAEELKNYTSSVSSN